MNLLKFTSIVCYLKKLAYAFKKKKITYVKFDNSSSMKCVTRDGKPV